MKVEITYGTHCKVTICEADGSHWEYGHIFHNLQDALEWAEFMIDSRPINFDIECAYITDEGTGELLAECKPDAESGPTEVEDYDDYDWGYNEDMGYDPYQGCYTDDC